LCCVSRRTTTYTNLRVMYIQRMSTYVLQNILSTRSVLRSLLNILVNVSRVRRVQDFYSVSKLALNVNDVSQPYPIYYVSVHQCVSDSSNTLAYVKTTRNYVTGLLTPTCNYSYLYIISHRPWFYALFR